MPVGYPQVKATGAAASSTHMWPHRKHHRSKGKRTGKAVHPHLLHPLLAGTALWVPPNYHAAAGRHRGTRGQAGVG